MSMTHLIRRPRAFLCAGCLAAVAVSSAVYFAGCNGNSKPVPKGNTGNPTTSNSDDRCDGLIASAMAIAQPAKLNVTSEPGDAVGLLNQWLLSCSAGEPEAATDGEPNAVHERLLSAEQRERLLHPQFVDRDVWHVRDCLLHRRTVEFAVGPSAGELDGVVQLFDYVVRNVHLVELEPEALPATPFHVWVFGQGTDRDRAWIFAELLRQMRIDAVILQARPTGESGVESKVAAPLLVGVLLEGNVYLFDPRLGCPIPSPADAGSSPTVSQPATLAEVLADPELLRRLDLDAEHPYPLRSDDLREPVVQLIGHTGLWSTRMNQLQRSLAGDRAVLIAETLADGPLGPGQLSRVAGASNDRWKAGDLAVWPFPEEQMHAYAHRTEDQFRRSAVVQLSFNAPIAITQDPKTGQPRFTPERLQLKTRIDQLLGTFGAGIQRYVLIRTRRLFPPLPGPDTETYQYMHARAAEDALVWSGVCQFESGDYSAAADTFRDYFRNYPQGVWTAYCWRMLAFSELEGSNIPEAITALEAIGPNEPEYHGCQLLIRRWRSLPASP